MRFDLAVEFKAQNPHWPVKVLCRVLGVSRSGYALYGRRQKQTLSGQHTQRQQKDAALLLHIRAAYRRGRCYSGSPRVHDDLREQGIRTSRKRVARLMKQNGLVGRSRAPRRVTTTDSRHAYPVAHNLLERRFAPREVERPDRFWCGDITYLPTDEGWVYLATVKDVFSRRIVGWALGETLEATLVEAAWNGRCTREALLRIRARNSITVTGAANMRVIASKTC
jgi:transposase InsO family protein